MVNSLLKLPRPLKRLLVFAVDSGLCVLSVLMAFYLRLGEWVSPVGAPFWPIIISLALITPLAISFGLYRAIFRYSGSHALIAIAKVVLIEGIVFSIVFTFVGVPDVPRTVGLIQPLLLFLLLGGSRAAAAAAFGDTYRAIWRGESVTRVLIYGAGSAGRQLASAIRSTRDMRLVGFLDDDETLWKSTISGVPILPPTELKDSVNRYGVTDVLLAIPSASRARRNEIVSDAMQLGLHIRTIPAVIDLASGRVSISDLKELEIEDLLGRSSVVPDLDILAKAIRGRCVLVTGAGGSIGSELCRQIARLGPATLILVDSSEYMLYTIDQELRRHATASEERGFVIVPLLASVLDQRRMEDIIATWAPHCIYHAAAYKHVPLVEQNPIEGVRNNVFGTWVVAGLAAKYSVPSFVLISTDKAVRPTNVMGTSKRLAELAVQAMHREGGRTRFAMVRFGNVLGSNGSVVPLFREQIAAGGPLTITDPAITRYFMTIPEAAQLVLQAGAMAEGGEVFVLDMGEPVRIVDLARRMVELSGLTIRDENNPDGDIAIEYVGLRPGEKLYEELLIGDDAAPTQHPRIRRAQERHLEPPQLRAVLRKLDHALEKGDAKQVRLILREAVPEFVPSAEIYDFLSLARASA
jgi:FlaA1/EpsC-like NDP-sugar epimerase